MKKLIQNIRRKFVRNVRERTTATPLIISCFDKAVADALLEHYDQQQKAQTTKDFVLPNFTEEVKND